jgi:hypothetical protein
MNREKAKLISDKIQQALQKIAEEENLVLKTDSISFSSLSLGLKITATESGDGLEKHNFNLSKRYGFTQNIVGMEFTCSNGTFLIEEFKVQNRKYPILARRKMDGTVYKFNPKNILKYLGGHTIVNRNANLKNLLD